jgi:hypothetical protein
MISRGWLHPARVDPLRVAHSATAISAVRPKPVRSTRASSHRSLQPAGRRDRSPPAARHSDPKGANGTTCRSRIWRSGDAQSDSYPTGRSKPDRAPWSARCPLPRPDKATAPRAWGRKEQEHRVTAAGRCATVNWVAPQWQFPFYPHRYGSPHLVGSRAVKHQCDSSADGVGSAPVIAPCLPSRQPTASPAFATLLHVPKVG